MFVKISFIFLAFLAFVKGGTLESDHLTVETTSVEHQSTNSNYSFSLSQAEKNIVSSIVHGKHVLARKQILELDPELKNFKRMQIIFEKVYIDNNESLVELKNFATDCKNIVIRFNVLVTLLRIVTTRAEAMADNNEDVGSMLAVAASEIFKNAMINNDYSNQNTKNVIKQLKTLDDEHRDDIIMKISKEIDRFASQSSIESAQNYYFSHLLVSLTNANTNFGHNDNQRVFIKNGNHVIEALVDGSLKLLNVSNVKNTSKINWSLETGPNYARIKRSENNSCLCMVVENLSKDNKAHHELSLFLDYPGHQCNWQMKPHAVGYHLYNIYYRLYLCARNHGNHGNHGKRQHKFYFFQKNRNNKFHENCEWRNVLTLAE